MLFDLHCDTAFEIYKTNQSLYSNTCAVSLQKYSCFDKKGQVFAIWSDKSLSDDECYLNFRHIADEFKAQIAENESEISLCTTSQQLKDAVEQNKLAAILAVEDARLVGNDLSRLEKLYEYGVRVITLGWQGKSIIGGSYDTDAGLTRFGFEVLKECENIGLIADVSHLSEKSFYDVASKATRPFIASHSNSKLLCNHKRNLTDIQIRTIAASGGICGIDLVRDQLSSNFDSIAALSSHDVMEAVCRHIEHFYSKIPENVCLGLDFDGTKMLPGLECVSEIPTLLEALYHRGLDEDAVNDISFGNAYKFFLNNLENNQPNGEE